MDLTHPYHPSDSRIQQLAHNEILYLLNKEQQLSLGTTEIFIKDTKFQIDGYSEDPPILCEIYSHVGKLKAAQTNKINKDILKMLLIDKMSNRTYRKIITFVDDETSKSFLSGNSWYSKLKDYFDIEFRIINTSTELKKSIINAQKRQFR